MDYTLYQKKALGYVGMSKVTYKKMWAQSHKLGYTKKGHPLMDIVVASDLPSSEVRRIVLLHEVGHIYYNHTSVDVKSEINNIRKAFEDAGKPFSLITRYGGPMKFLNIAMDLEVNSKLLTIGNANAVKSECEVEICVPSFYGMPVLDDFRDYYPYLIERLQEDDQNEDLDDQDDNQDAPDSGDGEGQGGSGNDDQEDGDQSGDGEGDSGDQEDGDQSGSGNDDQDDDSDDNGLPELSEGMEDIQQSVDPADFDDEIRKLLEEEDYRGDDDSWAVPADSESSVENEASDRYVQDGYGNSGDHTRVVTGTADPSSMIRKLLAGILSPSMVYVPDSLKHHNRGTRRNDAGLLYTSMRRRNKTGKKKLGILIDVSGSMNASSILVALASLKSSMKYVSQDSMVVTWDTGLVERFPIDRIPDRVSSGGGTDILRGVEYLSDEGCDSIVIYSDFETDNIPVMTELVRKRNLGVWNIIVGKGRVTDELVKYKAVCRNSIQIVP